MIEKILIYEANSKQALAMAKYINMFSNYYIVGVLEKKLKFKRDDYDKVIVSNFLDVDIKEFDYIFPMGANSTYLIINKYKNLYFKTVNFSIQNLAVFDKPKMLNIAESINVPIPKTFYHKNEITNFPIFYKENFENGGGVRGIAKCSQDIPKYDKLIYQEFINTPSTYGVGFLAKDGEIITYIQHKEVLSYPKDGGSAVLIETFEDKRLLSYTKILIKKINYNGWGLAEFKYCDKRDDYVFMEINAKFWASIEFALINNPIFLKELLNIQYSLKKEKSILFSSRLLRLSLFQIIYNLKLFFNTKIIKEESYIYILIKKLIPRIIKTLIKKL